MGAYNQSQTGIPLEVQCTGVQDDWVEFHKSLMPFNQQLLNVSPGLKRQPHGLLNLMAFRVSPCDGGKMGEETFKAHLNADSFPLSSLI